MILISRLPGISFSRGPCHDECLAYVIYPPDTWGLMASADASGGGDAGGSAAVGPRGGPGSQAAAAGAGAGQAGRCHIPCRHARPGQIPRLPAGPAGVLWRRYCQHKIKRRLILRFTSTEANSRQYHVSSLIVSVPAWTPVQQTNQNKVKRSPRLDRDKSVPASER